MQAMRSIKEKFNATNEGLRRIIGQDEAQSDRSEKLQLIQRPLICYYSQMPKQTMKQFIMSEEVSDYYIEKPIPYKELVSFLRLLNIL